MTIEQLLECSAEQLKAMSNAELLEHFKPYLNVTRPELAEKPQQSKAKSVSVNPAQRKFKHDLASKMAANLGIDLNFD